MAKLVAGPGVHICDACVGLCVDAIQARPLPTPAFTGWDSLGDEALSKALAKSEVAVELARDVLQSQIDVMRGRGKSWADVGAALGVSRQAAWERFG